MSNKRLNAKIVIGAAADSSIGRVLGKIEDGFKSVGHEIRDVEKAQKALGRQRDVLKKKGQDVEALDREYAELGETLDRLRQKQERYERVLIAGRNVGQHARDLGRQVKVGAIAAASAIGTVAAAGVGLAAQTANQAREIERLAQVSNASTTEFQRWARGAQTVGIEQEKMADILKDVNDRVGDFVQTGGGPMADFFEKIGPQVGITAENFKNLSGPEALQLYVSSLEKAGVSQQDFTFYMEAMASDSTLLLPLLREQGAEMRRLGDDYEALGGVMSEGAIASAREWHKSLGDLKAIGQAVRNTIGSALIPVIAEAARQMRDWLMANQDLLKGAAEGFTEMARRAIPVVGQVVSGIAKMGAQIGRMVLWVKDAVGGWENFGIMVGAVIMALPILTVAKLVGSVVQLGVALGSLVQIGPLVAGAFRAIGVALAANPIGAAVAVIAGAALLIWQNWDWLKQRFPGVTQALSAAVDVATNAIGAAFEWMKGRVGLVVDWLQRAADGLSAGWAAFRDSMTAIITAVADAFDRAKERIAAVVQWLGEAVDKAKEVGRAVVDVGGDVLSGNAAKRGAQRIGAWITGSEDPGPLQRRALGGAFRPGPLMVGETGQEMMFPDVGGWIAHHGHVRRLEGMARSAARHFERIALGGPSAAASGRTVSTGPISITINQLPGQDPRALVEELKRQLGRRGGDLFDGVFA